MSKFFAIKSLYFLIKHITSSMHKEDNVKIRESNENRKTEIKIRNIAPLSYKLADMLPML
jgi:hypothetical protein